MTTIAHLGIASDDDLDNDDLEDDHLCGIDEVPYLTTVYGLPLAEWADNGFELCPHCADALTELIRRFTVIEPLLNGTPYEQLLDQEKTRP